MTLERFEGIIGASVLTKLKEGATEVTDNNSFYNALLKVYKILQEISQDDTENNTHEEAIEQNNSTNSLLIGNDWVQIHDIPIVVSETIEETVEAKVPGHVDTMDALRPEPCAISLAGMNTPCQADTSELHQVEIVSPSQVDTTPSLQLAEMAGALQVEISDLSPHTPKKVRKELKDSLV